jgi:putative FmdB family regulatory protein
MPIYEYECRACHQEFELIVLKDTVIACPSCKGQDLERLLSGFSVNTAEMSQARVKAARHAARASTNFKDKSVAEAEHLREHVTEHMNEHGAEGPGPLRARRQAKE